ncbi:MAG TPA: chorismate mutase [Bacillota bacterium]|nr:chorismate mutase [Bacillota bacterium]
MVTRGIRGATTIQENTEKDILTCTKRLLEEMITRNNVKPEDVSHVFISVTEEIDAVFPAKALREFDHWTFVPVMCMREVPVQNSLPKCIRVMMVTHTNLEQHEVEHVFQNEAIQLRPDLIQEED